MSRRKPTAVPARSDGEGYHEMIVMVKVRRYGRAEGLDEMVEIIRKELQMRVGGSIIEVWRGK